MASPKVIVFFLFDPVTQVPVTGHVPSLSWLTYKDETGSNLSQPTFIEIGGGAYYFTPVFTSNHLIAYCINTGSGAAPTRLSGFLRPEDFNTDLVDVASSTINTTVGTINSNVISIQTDITILKKIGTGKWAIITSGPDANRIIFYDVDGTTPLYKFNLTDAFGAPTTTNPFTRSPV